jgi:propanol-preferring alcohol dehydrogenase
MRAMILDAPGRPLREGELALRAPGPGEIAIDVRACAVCRTDLHIVDGELAHPKLPLVIGHEIVGVVAAVGAAVRGAGPEGERFAPGARVGVPWLGWTCGACAFCTSGRENLCVMAEFTGYTRDGGYAEHAIVDARFAFALPDALDDLHAAPLLCAGLIGYRSLRFCGDARRIGLYGFGAAAHLVTQVARWQGREIYAFTRAGDASAQAFARGLGAAWAGASDEAPPVPLDAAIIFAPVGALVPRALAAVERGGVVVCGGIHMSDVPSFPYELLWGERTVRSVANLTRADADEFLPLAARAAVVTEIEPFALAQANEALDRLRRGEVRGAAVLAIGG